MFVVSACVGWRWEMRANKISLAKYPAAMCVRYKWIAPRWRKTMSCLMLLHPIQTRTHICARTNSLLLDGVASISHAAVSQDHIHAVFDVMHAAYLYHLHISSSSWSSVAPSPKSWELSCACTKKYWYYVFALSLNDLAGAFSCARASPAFSTHTRTLAHTKQTDIVHKICSNIFFYGLIWKFVCSVDFELNPLLTVAAPPLPSSSLSPMLSLYVYILEWIWLNGCQQQKRTGDFV